MGSAEALLVSEGRSVDENALTAAGWHVTQQASERVWILRRAADTAPADIPGSCIVSSDEDLASITPPLNESELLFVHAWLARTDAPPKVRPGDQLDWDSPGYEAPDSPTGGEVPPAD